MKPDYVAQVFGIWGCRLSGFKELWAKGCSLGMIGFRGSWVWVQRFRGLRVEVLEPSLRFRDSGLIPKQESPRLVSP